MKERESSVTDITITVRTETAHALENEAFIQECSLGEIVDLLSAYLPSVDLGDEARQHLETFKQHILSVTERELRQVQLNMLLDLLTSLQPDEALLRKLAAAAQKQLAKQPEPENGAAREIMDELLDELLA